MNGHQLVDLGCAFAQDIRQLVFNGVPAKNIHGVELEQEFVNLGYDLGYDLFFDKEHLSSEFLIADIFGKDSALENLDGKIDIVYASNFFHLFGW